MSSDSASARALPWWLKSGHIPWLGLVFAFVILLTAAGFLLYQRSEIEKSTLARVELLARSVEDQTEKTIGAAEVGLRSMSDLLADAASEQGNERIAEVLRNASMPMAFVRSVSIVDGASRVLVSSNPDNQGLQLPPDLLQFPFGARTSLLGRLVGGRDLADATSPSLDPRRNNFLPLILKFEASRGVERYLVAVINLDYLVNRHSLILAEQHALAVVMTFRGQLVTSTDAVALTPGMSRGKHLIFTDFLPKHEQGAYIGNGLHGDRVVTAFRALRQLPLIAVVELSYDAVNQSMLDLGRWLGLFLIFVYLLLFALVVVARRGLESHEEWTRTLKEADDALSASESRKWAVMSVALDAVLTIDSNACIVDFNPAAEAMFKRNLDEVVGLPLLQLLIPPEQRESFALRLRDYSRTDGELPVNQRIEMEGMRADGSRFPIEFTLVPLHAGGEVYLAGTIRDISDRRQVESERAVLLQRYQRLATDLERQKFALDEHAIVSISDEKGRIVYANDRLLNISRYSLPQLIGKDHSLLKSGRQPDEVYRTLWRTIASGEVWHGELVNKSRTGELYWVSSTIVPVLADDGRPRQYISIQTDISALRKAELALEDARRSELAIGARIQQSLLVTLPPSEWRSLWFTAHNQASQGVDGDFLELIHTGERYVDLIAGDVMGKGLPAALMGAATKLQISRSIAELMADRELHKALPQPAEIVSSVHRAMTPNLQRLDAFVTMCYLRFDLEQNSVTWVGCGHEEPILHRAGTSNHVLENQHPPLGVMDEDLYVQDTHEFGPGDALLLYSDGVTDAKRNDGDRVGRVRLTEKLRELLLMHQTPASVLHCLRRDLLTDEVQLTDDVTLAMVVRTASDQCTHRREFEAVLEAIREVRQFVTGRATQAGLAEVAVGLLEIAAVEVFTNVVRHAEGLLPGAPIELVTRVSAEAFEMDIVHLGDPFVPPDEIVDADMSEFPEGGFGLWIIDAACDRVQYLQQGGVNTIRMTKLLLAPFEPSTMDAEPALVERSAARQEAELGDA